MTEVLDAASMIDAAQEAVARGDLPGAEQLLREAAAVQETTLGSEHPDLATTLNNLAFVCERTNKIADAERNYRRAHAIAVASLGPKHPFVATSIKNLVDFCATHDIPIWKPPGVPADAPAASQPGGDAASESLAEFRLELAEAREESVPVARPPIARRIALASVGLAVIVGILFAMRSASPSPSDGPAPAPATPPPALVASPATAAESKPESKPETTPPPRVEARAARANAESPAPREKEKAVASAQPVTVLNARLCSALKKSGSPDWQCTSPSGDLHPGTYSFYTRLLTTSNATVEHRWYRDGRVHQTMRLRITANPSGGYRTFSSNTISPERAGDWKVELRAADGTLLHEERFVIR
jgi:Protein of unknown function (DUF2914)/Tetratricopeptide repeat